MKKAFSVAATVVVAAAACGDPPPPPPPPQPEPEPVVAPEPMEEEGTGGGGGGGAEEAPEVAQPKPRSGRPAVVMGPKATIPMTPVGVTPPMVMKLTGGATLKIPEYTLSKPFKMQFKILDGKAPKKGSVFNETVAQLVVRSTKKDDYDVARASDGPIEVRWAMGDESSVNLAVGTAQSEDDKNVQWKVIAPDYTVPPEAYFKVTELGPVTYFHATMDPVD